jgi:hypothetical protein
MRSYDSINCVIIIFIADLISERHVLFLNTDQIIQHKQPDIAETSLIYVFHCSVGRHTVRVWECGIYFYRITVFRYIVFFHYPYEESCNRITQANCQASIVPQAINNYSFPPFLSTPAQLFTAFWGLGNVQSTCRVTTASNEYGSKGRFSASPIKNSAVKSL